VYDALYEGLVMENKKFVFCGLSRNDIFTLGGDLEGFYGAAVAANFLEGLIDTSLGAVDDGSESSHAPWVLLTWEAALPRLCTYHAQKRIHDVRMSNVVRGRKALLISLKKNSFQLRIWRATSIDSVSDYHGKHGCRIDEKKNWHSSMIHVRPKLLTILVLFPVMRLNGKDTSYWEQEMLQQHASAKFRD
jgi:hypothetical protein